MGFPLPILIIPVCSAWLAMAAMLWVRVSIKSVDVTDDGSTLSALSLQLADTNLAWISDVETRVVAIASNSGPGDATDVVLSISVPAGLTMSTLPTECTGNTEIQCSYETIAVDSQISLDFGITPAAAGLYSVSVGAKASNLNGEAAASSIIVSVEDADGGDTGADAGGDGTGSETDGSTDSSTEPSAPVANRSSTGAMLWCTLMLLALALYMRQIHLSRVGRMELVRLAVGRNSS